MSLFPETWIKETSVLISLGVDNKYSEFFSEVVYSIFLGHQGSFLSKVDNITLSSFIRQWKCPKIS